jgi:hypothetical protein
MENIGSEYATHASVAMLSHQRNTFDEFIFQDYLQIAEGDWTLKLFKIGDVFIYDQSSALKAKRL